MFRVTVQKGVFGTDNTEHTDCFNLQHNLAIEWLNTDNSVVDRVQPWARRKEQPWGREDKREVHSLRQWCDVCVWEGMWAVKRSVHSRPLSSPGCHRLYNVSNWPVTILPILSSENERTPLPLTRDKDGGVNKSSLWPSHSSFTHLYRYLSLWL